MLINFSLKKDKVGLKGFRRTTHFRQKNFCLGETFLKNEKENTNKKQKQKNL